MTQNNNNNNNNETEINTDQTKTHQNLNSSITDNQQNISQNQESPIQSEANISTTPSLSSSSPPTTTNASSQSTHNHDNTSNSQNVLQVHENLTEDDLFVVDIEQLLSDESITFGAIDHRKPPVKPIPLPIPYGDKLYHIQYQEYLSHKEEYERVQLEKDTDKTLKAQMELNEFDPDMPLRSRAWSPSMDMVNTARSRVQQTLDRSREERHEAAVAASEELHDAAVASSTPMRDETRTSGTEPHPMPIQEEEIEPVTEHANNIISEVADDEDENPFAQFDPQTPSSAFGFGTSTTQSQRSSQGQSSDSEEHFNKHMIPIYPFYNLRQPRDQVRDRLIRPTFPLAPYREAPVNYNPNITVEEMNIQISNMAANPANRILSPLTLCMMQQTALMTLPPHPMEKVMELGLARATISYVGGAAIGAMFGMFFGSMGMFTPGSGVEPQKTTMKMMKETFKDLWKTTSAQSKFFAKMSFLFTGSEYIIAWLRTRHDPWNPILSGCFTGYVIATSNSVTKKMGSCAAFAAFSAVIEYVDFMALMTGE